uniref:Uncharacterized protein n=1 Tax=Bartonella schoenbuchensis (strain DSM 13525 / NCTC 13165 / R1) TaxID=687861 RepID=E6Z181_BARSR|nr:hypothetical protein BARSC_190140 [Bartonella schoenbuchensis R1]
MNAARLYITCGYRQRSDLSLIKEYTPIIISFYPHTKASPNICQFSCIVPHLLFLYVHA